MINPLIIATLLLCGCSTTETSKPPTTDHDAITVVSPTTELGAADDHIASLQLTPGKLITLNQVTAVNCRRAVKAALYIDVIAQDITVFADGMTDAKLDTILSEAAQAIDTESANLWGIHLPYRFHDISSLDENARRIAVEKLTTLVDLTMKHLRPHHFVIHPSTGTILTTDSNFESRRTQSRKSLCAIQKHLDSLNSIYDRTTILCVENCPRSVAYDAESILDLLQTAELEQVRVCLDTGHALIPLNGSYLDPVRNGDVIAQLRKIGTRLGTLHIQQNHGAKGREGKLDEHLEPLSNGLIDWGNFYKVLLEENRYRGCFLYETSHIGSFDGSPSTLESVAANYSDIVYRAFTTLCGTH